MIIGRSSSLREWFKYRFSVRMIANRPRSVCFRFICACLCLVQISRFGSSPVCMVVNGPGKVRVRLDYIKCKVPPPLGEAQANPFCFRVYWLFIIAKEFKYISTVLDQKLVCTYENVAPGNLGSISWIPAEKQILGTSACPWSCGYCKSHNIIWLYFLVENGWPTPGMLGATSSLSEHRWVNAFLSHHSFGDSAESSQV